MMRLLPLSVLLCIVVPVNGIEWLAIAHKRGSSWNSSSDCSRSADESSAWNAGLSSLQRRLCADRLELMTSVVASAEMTALVCQQLFYYNRWNCSSVLLAPNFMPDLNIGTREQAFVYALASASLLRSVAKACSAGLSTKCTCARRHTADPVIPPGLTTGNGMHLTTEFRWNGCDDNVDYGIWFSETFLDSKRKLARSDSISRMAYVVNRHNKNAGRQIMADSLTVSCKCHGVSGSCSVRTCWHTLPELHVIGTALLHSYNNAVRLHHQPTTTSRRRHRDLLQSYSSQGGIRMGQLSVDRRHLVFYNNSPDYCTTDTTAGSYGTNQRICQLNQLTPSTSAVDQGSCDVMCCGRGYTTETTEVVYRCQCKYVWCCYVRCKNCTATAVINRCR